ncbi:MAG: HNH endonuclease [Saprospiraceae bacterium]
MSKTKIPNELRNYVEERAKGYCEYCLAFSQFSPSNFEMEHIQPEAKDGKTEAENLALACRRCNGLKFTKTQHIDPISKEIVDLYHPRKDNWYEHFHWNEDETLVIGKTPKGRATIDLLQINRASNVNLRALLSLVGLHPPTDYP